MPECFTRYLEQVAQEIRWKRARLNLMNELKVHLQEQKADYLAQGMDPAAAEQETLRQMGDPAEIGRQLDQLHRPIPQNGFLVGIVVLMLAGLAIQLTIRAELPWSVIPETQRLLLWAGLGLAGLFLGYWADAARLVRYGKPIYALAVAAGLCLWMGGSRLNGAVYLLHPLAGLYPVVYALWLAAWQGKQGNRFLWAAVGLLPLTMLATQSGGKADGLLVGVCGLVLLLTRTWAGGFGTETKTTAGIVAGVAGVCLFLGFRALGVESVVPKIDWSGAAQWGAAGSVSELPELFWRNADYYLPMMVWQIGWVPFTLLCAGLVALLAASAVRTFRQKNGVGRLLAGSVWLTLAFQTLCGLWTGFVMPQMSASCPLLQINSSTAAAMLLLGGMLSVFRQEKLPMTLGEAKGQWKLVYQPAEE